MLNFDRFINTDINTTPFQLVIFGKDAPLLEVELNEAQYIIYNKLQLIAKRIIGNIFDGTMTASNSQLLINGIFCIDGHIINCDNISVPISASKSYYMNINIKSVTGSTVIKKNGYTGGDTIDNTIIDNRVGETTTGRKSIEFSISTNEDTSADSSVLIFSTSDSLGITKKIQDGKITTELSRLGNDISKNSTYINSLISSVTTIQDDLGITLTSTLSAGSTSVTFTHAGIKETSTFDVYTDIYGVNPKSVSDITVSQDKYGRDVGNLTLTFKAQSKDMSVKVVVK